MSWEAVVTRVTPFHHLIWVHLFVHKPGKANGFFVPASLALKDLSDDQLLIIQKACELEREERAGGPFPVEVELGLW